MRSIIRLLRYIVLGLYLLTEMGSLFIAIEACIKSHRVLGMEFGIMWMLLRIQEEAVTNWAEKF